MRDARSTLFVLFSALLFINQCGMMSKGDLPSARQSPLYFSDRIASPIVPTVDLLPTPLAPAADFAFRFTYGACNRDILDTFAGTYTKDMIVTSPITIPLTLTTDEQRRIYTKMHDIDIFGYPSTYHIDISQVKQVTQVIPATSYKFTIQNAGKSHVVQWVDDIVKPTAPAADRLRELANLIINIIDQHPEVQQLPIPGAGCW